MKKSVLELEKCETWREFHLHIEIFRSWIINFILKTRSSFKNLAEDFFWNFGSDFDSFSRILECVSGKFPEIFFFWFEQFNPSYFCISLCLSKHFQKKIWGKNNFELNKHGEVQSTYDQNDSILSA